MEHQSSNPSTGRKVSPPDTDYYQLVRGMNLRFVGTPAYVHLCSTSEQARDAVREAREHDPPLRITVRSGGHCYEGFVTEQNPGVIIDLSPLQQVYRENGGYWIEAGATLRSIYALLREDGVTLPAGSWLAVGAGGHFVGGGFGVQSREFGLSIDWLSGLELVRVKADNTVETLRVDRQSTGEDADIFWAHLGGGGGSFGIVTRYFFAHLPPAPAATCRKKVTWQWPAEKEKRAAFKDTFKQILQQYGQFFAANSGPHSPYRQLFTVLQLTHYSAGEIGLNIWYTGPDASLVEAFLTAMQTPCTPHQSTQPGPCDQPLAMDAEDEQGMVWLKGTHAASKTVGTQRSKYKSAYHLQPFSTHQIEQFWHQLAEVPCPVTKALVQVDSYGCAINVPSPAATATPHRSAILKLQYQIYWDQAEQDEACLRWMRSWYEQMYGPDGPVPDELVDGCYVNYPDADLRNWPWLYFKQNYARLQRAKLAADPLNVFWHAQSIRLPDEPE